MAYNEAGCEVLGVALLQKRAIKYSESTAKGTERGQVIAGITLQRYSQIVVPVDTGRLRASAFTAKEGSGFSAKVTVGYTTPYAIYVHEDLDAHHEPGKIAKYLTQPALEHADELREIIRYEARRGDQGSIPQLLPPPLNQHALLPIGPRPGGVKLVGGKVVTYVRKQNSKHAQGGGWRRKR